MNSISDSAYYAPNSAVENMDSTTFWTAVAAIGQVAGAIATFLAVVVSLWLARSQRRAYVEVRAGLRLIFAGDGSPFKDTILVQVTNPSLRPVRISSVGWRTGWLRRGPKWLAFQYALQKFDLPVSVMSNVITPPFNLEPGQEASLYISPDPFKADSKFREAFFSRRFPWKRGASPTKVCVTVFLVAAKPAVVRVERGLEEFLSTGVIANGADKANKAANAQERGAIA